MALAVGQLLYALELALASSKNRGGGELDGTYKVFGVTLYDLAAFGSSWTRSESPGRTRISDSH